MRERAHRDCRGADITRSALDNHDRPSLKLTLEEAGAFDRLNGSFAELAQHRARFEVKRGDNNGDAV